MKRNIQFDSSDWRYGYIESVGVHPRTSTSVYNACIGDGGRDSEPVVRERGKTESLLM